MGEVGEVMPDKSTTDTTITTGSTILTNGGIQNGVCKTNDNGDGGGADDEPMDVDTEDDSQISSSENGISDKSDGISYLKKDLLKSDSLLHQKKYTNNDDEKSQSSVEEKSNILSENGSDSKSRIAVIKTDNENGATEEKDESSQDSEKPESILHNHISDNDEDKSRDVSESMDIDSQSKTINDDDTTQESKTEDNEMTKDDENSNAENSAKKIVQDESMDADTNDSKDQDDEKTLDSKVSQDTKKSTEDINESTKDSAAQPDENSSNSTDFGKANGELNVLAKTASAAKETTEDKGNTSADDVQVIESDDDEDPFKDVPHHSEVIKNNSKKPSNDEDDDAVIIHSDSDNDQESEKNTGTKNTILQAEDDCVVIEDDDDDDNNDNQSRKSINKDLSNSLRRTNRQRKSIVTVRDFAAFDNEIQEIVEIDDPSSQQPPSKRQKTNTNNSSNSGPLNLSSPVSLAIKDARSLSENSPKTYLHSFLQSAGVSTSDVSVTGSGINTGGKQQNTSSATAFPVGLRPALAPLSNTQMPKLAPVSNLVNSNANLLPALTDDMFVLEAPSFIVPYIYEKPPSSNLREILTNLATEFDLNKFKDIKENQTDLDLLQLKPSKTDEDKGVTSANDKKAKKRKNRANGNDDESWGESDESTDDEASDDDSATRTKVLIDKAETDLNAMKSALAPAEQIIQNRDPLSVPGETGAVGGDKTKTENYFESPLGKFFTDIGIGLVQEYVQADLLKVQKRRLQKCKDVEQQQQYEIAINALTKNLNTSKKRNEPFKFNLKRCEFCNFKTESALAMANHYETPHMEKNMYKCNFCPFEIRQTQDIIFHMEAVHNIKGRLEKAPSYHQCPNCPFEDNGKSKMARHQPVCVKKFRPEMNLCPPQDWEAPAKIPRIKPRHGLVGTATAYQAMAAQAAAQKAALATLQQQQQQAARNLLAASNANRNRGNIGGVGSGIVRQNMNKVQPVRNIPNNVMNARGGNINNAQQQQMMRQQQQMMPQNVVLPNNYQISGGQLIQVAGSSLAILPNSHNTFTFQSKKGGQQPSISITPLPRQSSVSTQNTSSSSSSGSIHQSIPINAKPGLKPGQSPSGNKASFVICEICDGYIKDLEQLRNHMQWMHKVKIHPKMIYNRPPLNCQKCQFRFFTDQGLERHLLGSHGLVTSSMQEAANKGKDAGRCPVCGRMYQWKLLNHVSRDHNMTLKPAHLSYKCTVCTATFGMYKQFENHVYTAHSTVAKKAMANDSKKSNNNNSNNNLSNSSSSNRNVALTGTNDSLLKPLRINDEITIIPQPATKKS